MTVSPSGASGLEDLEALARFAVEAAQAAGAPEAEAWLEESVTREIRVYQGSVESLTDAGGRGLGIRVLDDGRVGYAYGTDVSEAGVIAVSQRALESAQVADQDPFEGLPEELGSTPVAGLSSPELAGWSTEQKVELALEVERAARGRTGISQVEDTLYSDADLQVALANSRGFAASFASSSAWAYASAFAGTGADLMTGLGLGLGRGPEALDGEAIGAEAAERALALSGARRPESRRCPVVLDAFVAASFLGFIGQMLSADAVQRGRSLFAGREGEDIAAPVIGLTDDPTDPDGLASSPFDAEGSPRRAVPLVEHGRLSSFLFDARTARRADRASTGSATRSSYRTPPSVGATNLVLRPGEGTLADLVAEAGEGLLVTDVVGLHSGVNPVSGTFSVGAAGRLISGGELGAPVREFTIASDLLSMLGGVVRVGGESRWVPFGGSVRGAPVLIAEMAVSGS